NLNRTSGLFPLKLLKTQSETSNAPVLDKDSSFLHFNKNPLTKSQFSLASGSRLANLKHSNVAPYLFMLNNILPASSQSLSASENLKSRARASTRLEKARQRAFWSTRSMTRI
ncbi:hypothetical protein PHJA_002435900, partial [Phtheirospermum japonicum]